MSRDVDKIEKRARALRPKEKAALAPSLIEQLDKKTDQNVEQHWIDEAQRRYDAYLAGEVKGRPGDEVMARVRKRLG